MNQEKIGKLIARLRKSKGLTQRELGEMVGVGFRSVSKWENGITSPDISIINDLSKILGISADELLKGEVNKNNIISSQTKRKKTYILPIILILLLSLSIIIINKNKVEVYEMYLTDASEVYVEGQIIFKNKNMNLTINKIGFSDADFQKVIIKNYQYEIYYGKELLVGYGYNPTEKMISKKITIKEFSNTFKTNYNDKKFAYKNEIIKDGFELRITFLDEKGNEIEKSIKINLEKQK